MNEVLIYFSDLTEEAQQRVLAAAGIQDPKEAWTRYLAFVDQGGTQTFDALVEGAGMKLPYAPGCIKEIGTQISAWIDRNPL